VREDEWIIVDVDHAGLAVDSLSDLVRIVGGGQAGADIQESADSRADKVGDRAHEELALFLRHLHDGRELLADLITDHSIDFKVVAAAQDVIPDPRAARLVPVDVWLGHPLRPSAGMPD
jgi:hypothetical protein